MESLLLNAKQHKNFLPVEEIVNDLLLTLDNEDLKSIKTMPKDKLVIYHFNFGMYIRNHYRLWYEDNPYTNIEEPFEGLHPDQISHNVIHQLWESLQ